MIGKSVGNFFVGVMFLTRLPVPRGLRQVEGRLARSAPYFPLIGVLIGLISGAVFVVASALTTPFIAAGLAVLTGVMVTGALHEDGLADCADGLFGGATRERALEIMRDSRIGTYGAAALAFSIGLRVLALVEMAPYQGLVALIVAHAVSRAMIPPVLVSARYARTRGLASSVAGGVTSLEAMIALLFACAVAIGTGLGPGLAAIAAAAVASGLVLAVLLRRLGGYTGDGLGAIQQCAEIATLITLAGALR